MKNKLIISFFVAFLIVLALPFVIKGQSVNLSGVEITLFPGHPAQEVLDEFSIPDPYGASGEVELINLDGNKPYIASVGFMVEDEAAVFLAREYYINQCEKNGFYEPGDMELSSSPGLLCKNKGSDYVHRFLFEHSCGSSGCEVFVQVRSI
ncbi:hypothetical protein [Marinobacter xestospongiae]|uniref:hypothetical protein n=1 Tax=Marinobacter xestospongiae TaxID=994319 RepID=UPI0020067088|nr:hypothetical protein [Marinobacter xestospongiae]MCK7565046.1 hypothetical protein [Marinobacter xestospongiae]